MSFEDDEWRFELSLDARERVAAQGGTPSTVRLGGDVADDFRRQHGALYPHVALWVTGLSGESVLALGGARFRHGKQIVGEWPARSG